MAKRALTVHEFFNILGGAYPTLKFDADQWGEYGYFYDPLDRQFGSYSIDRKNQCDDVDTVATAEELLAQHCSAERRPAVQAWLDSFRIGLFADQTLIWYPERRQLASFLLVVSPLVVTGEQEALAALKDKYAIKWLDEQIGRRSSSSDAKDRQV
jgi:hypothetical protein